MQVYNLLIPQHLQWQEPQGMGDGASTQLKQKAFNAKHPTRTARCLTVSTRGPYWPQE